MRAHATRSYRRTPLAGRARAISALLGACAAIGCGEPTMIERHVVIALSDATSCRPPIGVDRIRVWALGDGPGGTTLELAPGQEARTVPDAPRPVLALRAAAEGPGWDAIGYRRTGDRGDALLLLPPALSCGLADPEARAPTGAAWSVARDGALVVAGGLDDDGIATRRVVTLAPGAQTVEMAPVELASASAFASASALDDGRVLIAGGAITGTAPPYDTYEELDLADPDARIVGTLAERRRDHAAIVLDDGRVLLVGGRDAAGEALGSIEIVDRDARRGRRALASLALPRVAPSLALDDRGRVWIAGGETGAEIAIERFDPTTERIERHDLALPRADALAFLPGGRLAWIAGDRTFVVLVRDRAAGGVVAIEPQGSGPSVPEARAIATPAGSALVVGRERAFLHDPGRGVAVARITSVAPSVLAVLGDRSVVELAPSGAALRREEEPTPYDDPPATLLFAIDDAWVLLDPTQRAAAPAWMSPRFEQQGNDLVALVPGARADVRSLRASHLDVSILGEGALELVLVPERAPEIAIGMGSDGLEVEGCAIARAGDGPISIDPQRVSVGSAWCPIASSGPFGIAVRARETGARIVGVSIARR